VENRSRQPRRKERLAAVVDLMTLKLPYADYIRLKTVAAKRKTKSQAIMLEAVRAYLDKA
jgi:hypothetical protein